MNNFTVINDNQIQLEADQLIMQDLFDALYVESFFDPLQTQLLSIAAFAELPEGQRVLKKMALEQNKATLETLTNPLTGCQTTSIWCWQADESTRVYVPVVAGICQKLQKQSQRLIYGVSQNNVYPLSAIDFMALLNKHLVRLVPQSEKGTELFLAMIKSSVKQLTLSQDHQINVHDLLELSPIDFFQTMEQWASVRDRPYHPIAKAKEGISECDYLQYMAEFCQKIPLHWVAVATETLCLGEGINVDDYQTPSNYLLPAQEQKQLAQEMKEKGLSQSHTALPVHPWQLAHYIRANFSTELTTGTCHILAYSSTRMMATSSLRSMSPLFNSEHYLKLPMAIYSLAASRYLPAVKMINGGLSETLLRRGLALDIQLKDRVFVCNETKWWAYLPEHASLFDEVPRHLSAMVRTYPKALLGDEYRLIPMAALGTPLPGTQHHFFDDWMQFLKMPNTADSVKTLFNEVCKTFFDVNLRMFKIGMLAEIHGQNVVLVWRNGQARGLLLRDHDSLRIFVPWLERQGLADPEYCIKKGYANTLYHDNAEDLLFYLQTLGIQVNIRAIIDTLVTTYSLEASELWLLMKETIVLLLGDIGFSAEDKEMILQQLFEADTWPYKQLIKPIIARAGGPGSMPWSRGTIANPFHQLDAAKLAPTD